MLNSDPNRKLQAGLAICLFIVGLTYIFWGWLDYQHVNPVSNIYEASAYKERADARIANECSDLDGTALSQCRNEIEQSTRDAHRSQKDVKAQRYMALWAFVMAISAIAAVVVTFIGIVYIKATLDETRKAVSAANETVKVTQEIGRRQLRAYVTVSIIKGVIINSDRSGLRIQISINNTGQSPARKLISGTMHAPIHVYPPHGTFPQSTETPPYGGASLSVIGVGDPLVINKEIPLPTEATLRQYAEDGAAIHIYGSAYYEDIFEGKWRTDYCFWIRNDHLIRAIGLPFPDDESGIFVDKSAFVRANQHNDIT